MVHQSKALDLEFTDCNYQNPTYTGEIIPSQTSNLKHVEFKKF